MDKVKVGMIGAGGRADASHYPSLFEMKDAEIDAICELDKDRLNKAAVKYEVKNIFTDYRLMLKKRDLDAVYIIMSPKLLDPIVTYCLKKGKNVFIEKPPGTDIKETVKWAKIADKNGCITGVTFQRRFHPCVVEAKRILEKEGKIMYCMATFHKYGEWDGYGPSLQGDVIHVVDLLRGIGGDVKKVHGVIGQLYSSFKGHLNFYTATLEFERGGIGLLNSNRTAGGRALYFEMHTKGVSAYGNIPGIPGVDSLMIDRDGAGWFKAKIIKNEELIGIPGYVYPINRPHTHIDGSFQVNRHFIDCIKENIQPETNFDDAVKTMKLIKEIESCHRV
jgi:predicted dehydrogenase